jgi:cytoskeletal protein CcmA (bactofilin family)
MADEQVGTGSLLGNGTDFKGKLTFFGTVRIEGRMEGEIHSEDTLVVAPGGEVFGTIDVGTLIITGGFVKGNVVAKTAVEIHPGGRLIGEVETPVFQIERGAVFQGSSSMAEPSAPTEEPAQAEDAADEE